MTAIKMPQLGETVVEGTILKWLKQEGDEVSLDEPLFEISTDKVDTEVPSSAAGVLTRILVPEGETVAVGTEVAEIGEAGAAAASEAAGAAPAAKQPAAEALAPSSAAAPPAAPPAPEPVPSQMSAATQAEPLPDRGPRSQILSPLVRRLATEHSVDLSQVTGTGTGG